MGSTCRPFAVEPGPPSDTHAGPQGQAPSPSVSLPSAMGICSGPLSAMLGQEKLCRARGTLWHGIPCLFYTSGDCYLRTRIGGTGLAEPRNDSPHQRRRASAFRSKYEPIMADRADSPVCVHSGSHCEFLCRINLVCCQHQSPSTTKD